ncbi:MAG: alpha-amylase family glycosyl hydrolase [Fusobacteriaceae bacterium]
MVIYELHLLNFIEKNITELTDHVEYFKSFGVTHLEIMPIHLCSEESVWGYSPTSFSKVKYGTKNDWKFTLNFLKENGIFCILDVVYNHTSPFEKFDEKIKYLKINNNHTNYTGCGNSVDGFNKKNKVLIMKSLLMFKHLGFSGFRFDLGSVLCYDEKGNYHFADGYKKTGILEDITNSHLLKEMILINEPWSCHGHHKGSLNSRWIEWSDYFRDTVRSYIRCDKHSVAKLMNVMNDDTSVNYVTCHDGFTLLDLVSYNEKHNWINGEENCDGSDNNISNNNGVEGLTFDESIIDIRKNKIKIALAILLLSKGIPMLSAGDEVGKTQRGNNNAYKQIFSFGKNEEYDFVDFIKKITEFREKIDYSRNIVFCDRNMNEHVDLGDGSLMEFCLKFTLKDGGNEYLLINSFSGELKF